MVRADDDRAVDTVVFVRGSRTSRCASLLAHEQRAAEPAARGVRAAVTTLVRVRRDLEAERDRRRQVHVDPTGRACAARAGRCRPLRPCPPRGDRATVTVISSPRCMCARRRSSSVCRCAQSSAASRVAASCSARHVGAHRRARVTEVRVLRESVGFVHAASAAPVSKPECVRRDRGARRPRGGSGSSSARGRCRSAGSPRRRTA